MSNPSDIVDVFLDREYDFKRYNCGHFVSDVWLALTGEDIGSVCQSFLHGKINQFWEERNKRTLLKCPVSPCVCVMKNKLHETHAGVFIEDKILHLSDLGVRYEPIEEIAMPNKTVYYYR